MRIEPVLAAVRCRALGVGLLSGGYGPDELRQSVSRLRTLSVGGRIRKHPIRIRYIMEYYYLQSNQSVR